MHGDHADFRVRKKVFAHFLNSHHGDGIVSVCVKSALGENRDRVRDCPEMFYLPAYIGPRGWFGMYLNRGKVDWAEVRRIVEESYRLAAPKRGRLAAPKRRPSIRSANPSRRAGRDR